ncbi:MAG: recombinase family protein [Acidimicrobiia bacterium]
MKVALYLRISTEGEDAHSLDNHEKDLRAWAAEEGWTVVESYREQKSAKLGSERLVLEAAVQDAEAGNYEGLLVWAVDRFGRGLDSATAWVRLQQAEVDVYDRSEKRPLTEVEFAGALFASISERKKSTTRMRLGRQAKAEAGRWPGGHFPFGVVTDDDNVLIENPSQADELRSMAQAILTGQSPAQVAGDLDARGVRSSTRGGRWSPGRVRRLLRQPRLSEGYTEFWDVRLPHPVILDPGLHQRVLDRLDANRLKFTRVRTGPNPYPLTGRITDPEGHPWTGLPRRYKGRVIRYYRCSHYLTDPACGWRTARLIRAEEVEDAVWDQLMYVLGGGSADDRPPGERRFAHLHEAIVAEMTKVEAPSDQTVKAKAKEVRRLEDALADADVERRVSDDPGRVSKADRKLEQRLANARQKLRDLEALKAMADEERSVWEAVEEAAQRVTALRDETDPVARGRVFAELDISVRLDEPTVWEGADYDEGRYGIRLNGRLGEVPWESMRRG